MTSEESFESLRENVTTCLVDVTRTAGQLAGKDLNFLRTTSPTSTKQLDRQNARLLSLTRRLCRSAAHDTDVRPPELPSLDAIEDDWKGVVDLVDNLLEKADDALDELKGVIKKHSSVQGNPPSAATAQSSSPRHSPLPIHQNIPKPQRLFESPPQNDAKTPFKPLLRSKPHATVALEQSIAPETLESELEQYDASFFLNIRDPTPFKDLIDLNLRYKHPYATEIAKFKYARSLFARAEPLPPQPLIGTSATWVDTFEGVQEMLQELKAATEIAVDLEHHDTHSYIGIVCLMQISTRDKDWIVDTLKPWREDLQVINEVFADPRILKVFHGAASDIIWLQRDLGLYVVGLFDTYHASVQMQYTKRSLAFLLSKFVNFAAQKVYQLADWRVRPLTPELLEYARCDTHFLLYVYDRMRNDLLDTSDASREDGDLMANVLRDSKETALQRFERPFYDAERGMGSNGWYQQLVRSHIVLTCEQFAVFRAVHAWRDRVARQLDENPFQILKRDTLLGLARKMPTHMGALLGVLKPILPLLRPRMQELLGVVQAAKASGGSGPDMEETLRNHPATLEAAKRRDERRQEKAEVARSVSLFLQRERAAGGQGPLAAESSAFWGATVADGVSMGVNGASLGFTPLQLRLHVSLPPLTAEVFSSTTEPEAAPASVLTAPPEHAYIKLGASAPAPVFQQEVIVLREQGGSRKRKRQAQPDDPSMEAAQSITSGRSAIDDEGGSEDGDEVGETAAVAPVVGAGPLKLSKKQRKRANKKARLEAEGQQPQPSQRSKQAPRQQQAQPHLSKKQKKNMNAAQANGARKGNSFAGADQPAFDYATAPSMMNAAPLGAPTGPRKGKPGKQGHQDNGYNPYAKSLNAPKGASGKKGGGGKSATFQT